MAMNAAAQSLIALITGANLRFVIPVYQRPYSWDEEQCSQLWDDILFVGRHPEETHFTGSVVWVQDGIMSASGVTPRLLIDGQQRITTITLLLAALADFSREHPDGGYRFSHGEIMNRGYLLDVYKPCEDRYKLTLSQGDKATLISILENLQDPKVKIIGDSSRLIDNYRYLKKRIEGLEDPNIVWDGLQRLEVVSISLDAGKDNPQLIFESMNSTGKDLSSADLIRNYVLMGLPRDEQDRLYLNYWRRIEEALGADSYEEVFDEFIRNYLIVLYAPEPLARRNMYSMFKRHVVDQGYDKDGRICELLEELEAFAVAYSKITAGCEENPRLRAAFDHLAKLNVSVVNPLLLSLYDDFNAGAFEIDDFIAMAELLESYIFRCVVCDVASNSLNKFFPSIISKLNRIQEEGGNYREAFESLLALEAGTARRFPSDGEFEHALSTRDAYHFRRAFYLLEGLENMHHPKNPLSIEPGRYTIEHIMPQNALAHQEWIDAIGEDAEERFEPLLNSLGNLTLTAYNSELSDGSFEEKKSRIVGGYSSEYLVISKDVRDAEVWTPAHIEARARRLAEDAVARWPFLTVSRDAAGKYDPKPDKNPFSKRQVSFKMLFDAGLVLPGARLVSASERIDVAGVVTSEGKIALSNGEVFSSPSSAAVRAVALGGGRGRTRNGWRFWRLEMGPVLYEVRNDYLGNVDVSNDAGASRLKTMFWSGFFEFASEIPAFVETFGDPSERGCDKGVWASFRSGVSAYHFDALLHVRDGWVGADLWCKDRQSYEPFYWNRHMLDEFADGEGVEAVWDDLDVDKKTRTLVVKKPVDFDADDWSGMYALCVEWLLRLRRFTQQVDVLG